MINRVQNLSRVVHDLFYRDTSQSLCSRAWEKRRTSRFWAMWVETFGPKHCESSWRWYHPTQE